MNTAILIFLCAFTGAAFCLPPYSAAPRVQRAETPAEYMRELFHEMFYLNGTELKQGLEPSTPTDVWCFSDRDVVKKSYRKKQETGSQCSTLTCYVFQWQSLSEVLSQRTLSLKTLYMRVHLKVDQRYAYNNEKFTLELTLDLHNASKPYASHVHASLTQEMTLSEVSDQWVELDLTKAAMQLWPQEVKHSTEITVSIKATGDCVNGIITPPIRFVSPAEIPLNAALRNSSVASSQPLLVVFAIDDIMNQRYQRSHNVNPHSSNQADRHTRSASDECQRHDHMVTFRDIGFPNTIPTSLNIGKCSGSCSSHLLRQYSSLATNHARLMSSIRNIQDSIPTLGHMVTSDGLANIPCCVPSSYRPQTALYMGEFENTTMSFSLRRYYFNDLIIESCGCN